MNNSKLAAGLRSAWPTLLVAVVVAAILLVDLTVVGTFGRLLRLALTIAVISVLWHLNRRYAREAAHAARQFERLDARDLRTTFDNAPDAPSAPAERTLNGFVEIERLVSGVKRSALDSEGAARKLAAQVGDTLAATASIASQTADALNRVQRLSDEVSDGASAMEEIQAAVDSLARRIEDQNGAVDQSAAAVEQMSASIAAVANVADTKRRAADHLTTLTAAGSQTVGTTDRTIGEVGDSMETIHGMIAVIDEIAARTNLLAMNAAIEAAHAGASGRGFAVVAGEIRKLAETTGQNASQIASTLGALVEKISQARAASAQTAGAFREIEQSAHEVSNAFSEISVSTGELSIGTREVVSATESLREITAEIVGAATEMRLGAKEVTDVLSKTRETSRDTVERMNVVRTAATDVAVAANRISALSIDNNQQITRLLEMLERFVVNEQADEAEARARLKLANIMLKHISWVGRARLMIDGREAINRTELVDHTACDLGQWLTLEGKTVVANPESYRALSEAHRRLHAMVAEIVDLVNVGRRDSVEQRFQELLQTSNTIVEMLSAYQTGSFVSWNASFSVAVPTFDQHHQRLFGLISKLYDAMNSGAGKSVLTEVFDELLSYTDYHFNAEERAFEHFKYPDCAVHRGFHQELIKQATRLRADLEAGKALVTVEVMEFLRDWVTNHIKRCDKLYSPFFRNTEVEQFLARIEREQRSA